ncbi:hypothetical protein OG2516_19010 [Oceanicola granulosus HTCC2516]|uniref:Uncharacterized protein n=1 Tax=Oceanicola granulosus (strain ATCC BAA-861 / DSM 15982 / KCTC 12143 / HTCC2516) TaxID=314256 RepID=Q2CBR6_OCEGH|nr:DUF2793 domain-containing protein [Oceanicola granulosus]EAR50138.1 hypothetical protein OG2516_19010 [Oceanicola granulosus HTCC2516]
MTQTDRSDRLALPYLLPAQAQKHVTHNEALEALDVLVQLAVEAVGTSAPPASPAAGEAHVVGAGAGGAWAGQDGRVAAWSGSGWVFHAPRPGWRAWDKATATLMIWSGSAWLAAAGAAPEAGTLGVNTSADATNRLAVAAPATLLTHEGAGHRLTINKAAAGDTASLLFQSGWSGRAEIGLAGTDALSLKVSADGSAWTTALAFDPASGALLPATHPAAALPPAATAGAGAWIHVDGIGPAWSDGTAWRRMTDNTAL